jgi:alginate O-acetyltransferase complex protein AlgI
LLFNSFTFLIFLSIVFLLYWFVFQKNLKLQNTFLLLSSYVFYGWWDWRFLGLILASSAVDYWCGMRMSTVDRRRSTANLNQPENEEIKTEFANSELSTKRPLTVVRGLLTGNKLYLTISIAFNLGLLGFFKYFNFFIESAADFINLLGFQAHTSTLNLILPVGISFYTFQTMSYTIDVYRGKMDASKDPIAFFTFVAFFPQLVAGPIERASNLLPQFFKKREFNYQQSSDGMKLILWGLFKKMVIADNCALVVNQIFENYQTASGLELIIGAILFAFQIYGDFSGYSEIAIGVAKLFGFDLMANFRTPYFSRDIAEFWRRWHISLSTWFRDYLYIPLGGSRVSKAKAIRNIFIVFLVSGFWHGANWTFIAWGGIHAVLFIPLFLQNKNRMHLNEVDGTAFYPGLSELFKIVFTFLLVCIAWVFFRAETVSHAWEYLMAMVNNKVMPQSFAWISLDLRIVLIGFLAIEWVGRSETSVLIKPFLVRNSFFRNSFYYVLIFAIFWMGGKENQFIYFQF